jgi:hypothetical protein
VSARVLFTAARPTTKRLNYRKEPIKYREGLYTPKVLSRITNKYLPLFKGRPIHLATLETNNRSAYIKKLVAITRLSNNNNEVELRRSIAKIANRIAFETAPKLDVVRADWVVVSAPYPLRQLGS